MNNDLKNPPFKTIRKIIDNHLKKNQDDQSSDQKVNILIT